MPKQNKSGVQEAASYLGLGLNLAITFIVFVYLGKWADTHYGRTDGLFVIIGAALGFFSGLYHFIKSVLHLEKKSKV
ncbi:MAG: AtpZ/AtpI family protein [Ignavibacteria bacterium]|nr:AtpZ/AtpI family protein [Ignavibacteria bacterium]